VTGIRSARTTTGSQTTTSCMSRDNVSGDRARATPRQPIADTTVISSSARNAPGSLDLGVSTASSRTFAVAVTDTTVPPSPRGANPKKDLRTRATPPKRLLVGTTREVR
jgi:hypothetical protein